MKVALKPMPDGYNSWVVVDQNGQAISPIERYLDYLYHLQKSPNTLRAYAYHLMHYWQYLSSKSLSWSAVTLEQLAGFITWLRLPASHIVIHATLSKRTENSINAALAAVTAFYKFQEQLGEIAELDLYQSQLSLHEKYKPFLHHLNTTKQQNARKLKIKVPQRIPMTLTRDEVKQLLRLCFFRRDKFLITLLYETGIRIGQALGLFHEDIRSFDNEIHIIPRIQHVNQARAKTYQANRIPVSQALMHHYSEYVINELPATDTQPYVFVALQGPHQGQPLRYTAIQDLFNRFSRKLERKITPHMLRHTHATDLIQAGWNMALVQKRLGHKSIQSTVNTYTHLTDEAMKTAFKHYQEIQNDN